MDKQVEAASQGDVDRVLTEVVAEGEIMKTLIPVLLYHSVADDVAPGFRRWSVRPEMFTAQMEYLSKNGYTPITVTQLAATMADHKRGLPLRPVVITFDDGLADFYTTAWPILHNFGFPSTLYIVTGHVEETSAWLAADGEGDRPMMTWSQVREVCEDVECGAHSHSHPQLDTLHLDAVRDEIVRSRDTLEEHLGQPVMSFAYPHGYYSPGVRRLVQEAGFSSACGVKHAMSVLSDDRFALSRIIVSSDVNVQSFSRLLAGEGLPVAPGERIQTKMWRWYRSLSASLHDGAGPYELKLFKQLRLIK